MLSRIGRVIRNHREDVGLALVGISFFWLLGVAGTDDFYTAQHIFQPILPLVIKSAFGLLGLGIGVRILNGGDQDDKSQTDGARP